MSGEKFRKVRTASGVTITEMSHRTGISKVRISLWEQNLTRMWPHELEILEKTIVGLAAERRDQIGAVLGDVAAARTETFPESSCESEPGRVAEEPPKPRRQAVAG